MKKLKSLFNRKGKKTEEAANNQPTVAEEPVVQQNGGQSFAAFIFTYNGQEFCPI
jgi:hypothetical protein